MTRYLLPVFLFLSLVLFLFVSGCGNQNSSLPQDNLLVFFSEDVGDQVNEITVGLPPYISRSRSVKLNPNALTIFDISHRLPEQITLNLFKDVRLTPKLTSREETEMGVVIIIGYIENASYSEITLVYQDGVLTGGIAYEDKYFKIESHDGENARVLEIDQKGFPDESQPLIP
jgi:hypothetical protein